MRTVIKKAAASTAASENIEQTISYRQTFDESNKILKEFLGALLLRLVAEQAEPSDWQLFDQFLRQHYSGCAI